MTIQLLGGVCDGKTIEVADDERIRFVTIPSTTGRTVWRPYFGDGPMLPYSEFRQARYRIDRATGTGTFMSSENL